MFSNPDIERGRHQSTVGRSDFYSTTPSSRSCWPSIECRNRRFVLIASLLLIVVAAVSLAVAFPYQGSDKKTSSLLSSDADLNQPAGSASTDLPNSAAYRNDPSAAGDDLESESETNSNRISSTPTLSPVSASTAVAATEKENLFD